MHILIIEDDTRVAELINRVLSEEGFQTTLAYDGTFGSKLALQHDFDIIITDVILPGINGLDLVKSLRSHRLETPILMLTALGTTDDKVEGFDAGADDYLVKPFEIRELMARIKVLLKRKNAGIHDSQ
ncbi:MAG: response regulator transcription factor, partial [Flavobacterium sp.]